MRAELAGELESELAVHQSERVVTEPARGAAFPSSWNFASLFLPVRYDGLFGVGQKETGHRHTAKGHMGSAHNTYFSF